MLDRVAKIIFNAFEKRFPDDRGYLEEKRVRLSDIGEFQSLLFLNNCDDHIRRDVAEQLGVTHSDLIATIGTVKCIFNLN